jgi:aryl-alcohol dehydrogenase-like predicted oxidoreductase
MGMSEFYGPIDESAAMTTIHQALDRGVNLLDTADICGRGTNEVLIGRAIKGRRSEVILATKFGMIRDKNGGFVGFNGRPEYVKQACDRSLSRDKISHQNDGKSTCSIGIVDAFFKGRCRPLLALAGKRLRGPH